MRVSFFIAGHDGFPGQPPGKKNLIRLRAADTRAVLASAPAPRLAVAFKEPENSDEFRPAAARALIALDSPTFLAPIVETLADTNQPPTLREQLAVTLADQNSPSARAAVLAALQAAPQRLQLKLAVALARSPAGAAALLTAVEQKKLPTQVIADRAVKERLAAAKLPRFTERFAVLTNGLSPASAEWQKLMDQRRTGYASAPASAERGRAIFEKAALRKMSIAVGG